MKQLIDAVGCVCSAGTVRQEPLEGIGTMINGLYDDLISEEELLRVSSLLKENLLAVE